MHRYIPAIAKLNGYKVEELEVSHRPRIRGRSKYGASRIAKGLSDLMMLAIFRWFGRSPAYLFNSLGLITLFLGLLLLLVNMLTHRRIVIETYFLLLLSGCQILMIGILCEMSNRIRYRIAGRELYKVKEIVPRKTGEKS